MRIKSPLLIKCCGRLSSYLLRSVFGTLQQDLHCLSINPYDCTGDQRYLFSVWHDSSIIAAFGGPHHRTVALTSRHRDGSFVESVLAGIGVPAVRGSTGKTGQRATRELLETANRCDIVITPDGPRGPVREMSRGIIYLASRTHNPIVPTAFVCEKPWTVNGKWAAHFIPKPFSRVVCLAGNPISIPADLSTEHLEPFRGQVQEAMDDLNNVAAHQLIRPVENPFASYRDMRRAA